MVLGNFELSWTEDGWMMGVQCSRWGKVQQVHIGSALHNAAASTPLMLQPAVHQLYSNLASATPSCRLWHPPPPPHPSWRVALCVLACSAPQPHTAPVLCAWPYAAAALPN